MHNDIQLLHLDLALQVRQRLSIGVALVVVPRGDGREEGGEGCVRRRNEHCVSSCCSLQMAYQVTIDAKAQWVLGGTRGRQGDKGKDR